MQGARRVWCIEGVEKLSVFEDKGYLGGINRSRSLLFARENWVAGMELKQRRMVVEIKIEI